MSKKMYEETHIAAIAAKIRELTGTVIRYTTEDMPEGVEEVAVIGYLAGLSELNDAIQQLREAVDAITESRGVASGIATLDENGHVPSTQLPSYVDSVVEGYISEDRAKFYEDAEKTKELRAESGKIYLDIDTLCTYRWGGTRFAEISESLALGETSATAFPGDKGKAAYNNAKDAIDMLNGLETKTLKFTFEDGTTEELEVYVK